MGLVDLLILIIVLLFVGIGGVTLAIRTGGETWAKSLKDGAERTFRSRADRDREEWTAPGAKNPASDAAATPSGSEPSSPGGADREGND